jgi:hypothetical protein
LIWVSDYFDRWLPACAGMTDFFVMYGEKFTETNISFTLGEKPLKIMKEKAILDDICIGFA